MDHQWIPIEMEEEAWTGQSAASDKQMYSGARDNDGYVRRWEGERWYREGCGWFGGQIVMVMVEWWHGGGRKTWMSILYAFAGLFQAKTPRATRIPVPARHVDRSAVIEVGGRGGVCVS